MELIIELVFIRQDTNPARKPICDIVSNLSDPPDVYWMAGESSSYEYTYDNGGDYWNAFQGTTIEPNDGFAFRYMPGEVCETNYLHLETEQLLSRILEIKPEIDKLLNVYFVKLVIVAHTQGQIDPLIRFSPYAISLLGEFCASVEMDFVAAEL